MRHYGQTKRVKQAINAHFTSTDAPDTSLWWKRGKCRGYDPKLWFPEWPKPNEYSAARRICASCPVRRECLNDALTHETNSLRYGMFGGTTPQEREAMAAKAVSA